MRPARAAVIKKDHSWSECTFMSFSSMTVSIEMTMIEEAHEAVLLARKACIWSWKLFGAGRLRRGSNP